MGFYPTYAPTAVDTTNTPSVCTRRVFLRSMLLVTVGGVVAGCNGGQESTPVINLTSTLQPRDPGLPKYDVLAEGLDFPEGPAFDPQGNLWCTEIGAGTLVKLIDGKVQRMKTGGRPNSMAFDKRGRIWMCDSDLNKIRRLDFETSEWETILEVVEGDVLQTPNDLSFDAQGNLIFSCPNFADLEQNGYVVCLTPERRAIKIATGLYRPNGVEIVDGGKALVIADTYQKVLFKGAWDDRKLEWKSPVAWCQIGGAEGPDGMAFGADGLLYQAVYGDGVVRVVGVDGKITREIKTPGSNVTNVAIDPSGRLGIVVTETEKGQLLSYPLIQPGAAIYDGGDRWK